MAVAEFDGIEIPLVYSQETTYEIIGDEGRVLSGRMRRDVLATKRAWTLQTRPMPKSDRDTLIDHLISIDWGAGDFWIQELGPDPTTDTVRAFVTVDGDERSLELPDRQVLSLVVMEE